MRQILVFILLFAIASAETVSADQPSLEAYARQLSFRFATLSPDGDKIAMLANIDGQNRIVIITVDGDLVKQMAIPNDKPRGLSFFGNQHIILTVSETTKVYGFWDEYENSGSIAIDISTGKSTTLLSGTNNLYPAQGGLGKILGQGPDKDTALMRAYIGRASKLDPPNSLLKVDLYTGRGERLHRGTNETIQWVSDGKGDALVRVDHGAKSNRFTISARDNDKWNVIYSTKTLHPPFSIIGVNEDRSAIILIESRNDNSGFDRVMQLGLNGTISGPVLEPKNKEIENILYDQEGVFLGVRYFRNHEEDYDFIDENLSASFQRIKASLPGALISLLSWSDDRRSVLYRVFAPSLGHYLILDDIGQDNFTIVADMIPDIPTAQLGEIYNVDFKARDGLDILTILTVPRGTDLQSRPNLPIIMLPHGGPAAHDSIDYHWMGQYFANRGYGVVQPNFRGSIGFGQVFEDAGRGEWGNKMRTDLEDVLARLGQLGIANEDRVCIVGASYGGYAALAGATMSPNFYKCAVSIAGISDMNRMLTTKQLTHGKDNRVVAYWKEVMTNGQMSYKQLKEISPITHAAKAKAPILLIHGDDDTIVPMRQSRNMERALKRADKDVTFVRLKDGDHWLSYDKNRIETLQAIDAFLKEHLPVNP